MALGPNDLQLTDDEERYVGRLEETLDALLRDNYAGPGQPTVVVLRAVPGYLTPRIRQEAIRRYRKAGWKEVKENDTRWTFAP